MMVKIGLKKTKNKGVSKMEKIILVFVIIVMELIIIVVLIDLFNEKLTKDLIKRGRLNKYNHPDIIHEMVHVRIHKRFGFKEWRIVQKNENLVCIMTLHENIMFPKYFPKIFLWGITHLIHDTFLAYFCLDIINIVGYTKDFILVNRMVTKEMLKTIRLRKEVSEIE